MVPVPAHLVWDGLDQDLNTDVVHDRLIDCQHDSLMITHTLTCLYSIMVRVWRASDARLPVPAAEFYSMLPRDARVWAHQCFQQIVPTLAQVQTPAAVTKPKANAVAPQQASSSLMQQQSNSYWNRQGKMVNQKLSCRRRQMTLRYQKANMQGCK